MMKKNKKLFGLLVCIILLAFLLVSGKAGEFYGWVQDYIATTKSEIQEYDRVLSGLMRETVSSDDGQPAGASQAAGQLSVHFIDVGNADAILLVCENEAALVDAGENDNGDMVRKYLENQGVASLKYAVGTHPHADHIGGLDTVLYAIPTETVYMPAKEHTTKTYNDVLNAIRETNTDLRTPVPGQVLPLGAATLTILSPDREWEDLNNNSIVLYVENGEDSFLLAGDAERDAENAMLDAGLVPKADVLKLGHHGSNTSSSYRWLNEVLPKYCVIPCGAGNEYGHPHEEVLSRLSDLARTQGTVTYRSDLNGNIIAHSNGDGNILFETERET